MPLETISATSVASNGQPITAPAAAEPVPSSVPPAAAEPPTKDLDPATLRHLTKLSAQNRSLQKELEAAKAAPPKVPEDVSARLAKWEAIEKASPLERIKLLGLSYEQLTEEVLKSDPGEQPDPKTAEALARVQKLEEERAAEKKAREEQEAKDKLAAEERAKTDSVAQVKARTEAMTKYITDGGEKWALVAEKGVETAWTTADKRCREFLVEDNKARQEAGKEQRAELTWPEKQSILDQVLDRLQRWYAFEAQDNGEAETSRPRREGLTIRENEPPAGQAAKPRPGIGAERGPTTTLTAPRRPLAVTDAKAKAYKAAGGT